MNKSFIYAIQSKSGLIKIGFSRDPIKRLQGLKTANGEDLSLVGCWAGNIEEEKSIHFALSNFQAEREWFYPTKTVIQFLKEKDPNFLEPQKVSQVLFWEEVEYWKKKREKAIYIGLVVFVWAASWRDAIDIFKFWNQ